MLHQHKKEGFTAIAVALVLGITVSTGGFLYSKNGSSHEAVLGASVTSASVKVTLKKVQVYSTNTSSQLKRVSVTIAVFNNSGKLLQISPGLQMQLVDKSSASHAVTAAYLPAKVGIGGPLKSGNTWTQAIDFEISANQTPSEFIYQPEATVAPVKIAL